MPKPGGQPLRMAHRKLRQRSPHMEPSQKLPYSSQELALGSAQTPKSEGAQAPGVKGHSICIEPRHTLLCTSNHRIMPNTA